MRGTITVSAFECSRNVAGVLPENGGIVEYLNGFFTSNGILSEETYDATPLKQDFGPVPDPKTLQATRKVKLVRELLLAWDPIAQKAVLEQETSSRIRRRYDALASFSSICPQLFEPSGIGLPNGLRPSTQV